MKKIRLSIAVVLIITGMTGCVGYSGPKGVYFSKKSYVEKELPVFSDIKDLLPQPVLDENPDWLEMYWKCWELAFDHLKKPTEANGFVSNYLDEAFNPNIFQWDTIFMVMFARYGHEAFPAIQSLDNFYASQHENGFICREIWETNGFDHHRENSPEAVNPPLFSWAEMENFRGTGDKSRFEMVLPVLENYVAWLETARKRKTVHDLYWNNGLGSGMDNTPRSGSGWVDMSSQMVMQYKDLAEICRVLGYDDKASGYLNRAEVIAEKINRWMWNDEDGLYYDVDDRGIQVKWKTAGCFWPMLAGITSEYQENRLIKNLNNSKTFKRKNLYPTLAADQPGYDPTGRYWLGGVWAPTNYMIIRGLSLRGYNQMAYDSTVSYLDSMYRVFEQTGTVWELYAPDTDRPGTGTSGEGGAHQARPDFVGWSGCGPIAMLIENILGLRADAVNSTLVWHILRSDRFGIKNFSLGSNRISLICSAKQQGQSRKIQVSATEDFTLKIKVNSTVNEISVKKGKNTFSLE